MPKTSCVVCNSPVTSVLDLNIQPLANNLLERLDEPFDVFPLGLSGCCACGHAQLTDFVEPKLLFKNYLYASGTSRTLQRYFRAFSAQVKNMLPSARRILEIASNDGSLLSILSHDGFEVVGVDPAENLTREAANRGLNVMTGFFPETAPAYKSDIIIAMNVVAHNPNPGEFMRSVAKSLAPGGVAIIQTSQSAMIANGEFDTIYHEHYSFFSVNSMRHLADAAGLVLEQTQLVSVHGTSFLFFVRHLNEKTRLAFDIGPEFSVQWPETPPEIYKESFRGHVAEDCFREFAQKSKALTESISRIVNFYRASGHKIALIGVAAKALTFIRAADISPDWYFDEAPLKVGRFVPGCSESIRDFKDIAELDEKAVFLIGAWNFAEEIIGKIDALNLQAAHRYLVHLPTIRDTAAQVRA